MVATEGGGAVNAVRVHCIKNFVRAHECEMRGTPVSL